MFAMLDGAKSKTNLFLNFVKVNNYIEYFMK